MSVEFVLDMFDAEEPLTIDLGTLSEWCVLNDKDIPTEFSKRVLNYIAYAVEEARSPGGGDPVVYSCMLEIEGLHADIPIEVDENEGGWTLKLGKQIDAICQYATSAASKQPYPVYDLFGQDEVMAYFAYLWDSQWTWEDITLEAINERMMSFVDIFDSAADAIQHMVENDHEIDAFIPEWVEVDWEATAEAAERKGVFSCYEVNTWGSVAVWR